MALEVVDVEQALLALAPAERAAVIERGLLSLDCATDADQVDVDVAWDEEVERRVSAYVAGEVILVDADAHYAQLRARLATRGR